MPVNMSQSPRGIHTSVYIISVILEVLCISMEEDCGAFAADCVVLSCCCQCLVLQVTVFVFFKVPRKLGQKIKKFVKRRCGNTLHTTREEAVVKEELWCGNGFVFEEGSSRSNCTEDIERMLQERSMSKEFGFGSFWRHEDSSEIVDVK
ncbi:BnaCnng34780D [Brassica napus]|uniref:(rape) hypothetical protein n=1 Tax=Brassica napus TaxID=3708 RepID=A0A078J7V4_BRANA|nr:PREDICTED: uncharacterized protein LOC106295910 [Brassica oleracea var. oleracea]XP_048613036.1 uncharacterized protein LOC125587012 [Brassica napus]CAF1928193.1 unnamed protein product [Brassica napus]CDY59349.1 BnaCnng34780D [Brassica napus]